MKQCKTRDHQMLTHDECFGLHIHTLLQPSAEWPQIKAKAAITPGLQGLPGFLLLEQVELYTALLWTGLPGEGLLITQAKMSQ